jgi:hypothetical protein
MGKRMLLNLLSLLLSLYESKELCLDERIEGSESIRHGRIGSLGGRSRLAESRGVHVQLLLGRRTVKDGEKRRVEARLVDVLHVERLLGLPRREGEHLGGRKRTVIVHCAAVRHSW